MKKHNADPLTDMKKCEMVFQQKKEMKALEEERELKRASVCMNAMPSLFPDDISIPKGVKCVSFNFFHDAST